MVNVTLQKGSCVVKSPSHTYPRCQSETKAIISVGYIATGRFQNYSAKMHAYSAEAKIRLYQLMI